MNESITPELIFQQALQQTQGNVINLIAGLFQFSHQVRPEENRLPLFSRLMEIYEVKIQLDIQVRQQLLEFFSKQIDAIIPDLSYQLIVVRTLYSMCMTLFPQFQEFFFQRLSSFLNAANMETPDFFFVQFFSLLSRIYSNLSLKLNPVSYYQFFINFIQIYKQRPRSEEIAQALFDSFMKTKFLFSNEFKNAIFYELLQFLQENIAFPPILELLRNLEIPLDVSILPLIDRYTNTPPSPGDDFCECYTSLKSIRGQCGQLLVTFLNFLPQMVQNPELIINLWIDLFFQSNNFFLLSVMLDYCQPSQISHLIETLVSTYKQTEQMPRNIPDYLYLYCSFLVTNIYKSNEIPPIILQCIESLKSVQNSVIYRTLLYKVIYSITKFTGVIGEGFPEFMAHEYMKISESDSSCLMIPSNDCLNFFILLTKNQQQINENLGHLILQLASNLMIYIFKLIEIGHPERLNTAFELLNAIFVQFGKRNIEISSTIISNILDFLITEYDDIIQNTENIPILLQLLRTFIMFPLLTNGLTKEFNAEFYKYFMSQLVESPGSIQRMYDDLNTRYINDHKFAFLLLFFKIALDNEYRENIEDLVKTALLIIEKCDISEGKLAKYIMNIFFQYFFDEYVDDFSPDCIKASCTLFSEGELSLHSDSLANIVVLFFHIFEKFTINDAGFITGLFNLSSEVLLQSDEPATTMAGVLIFAGCMKQIGISQFVTNQDYFEKLYDFLQIIQSDKFCPFSITGRNSVEVTIVMQALQAMSVEPAFKQHGIDVSEIINEVLRNEDPVLYTDFAYRTQRISLESIFDL